MTHHLHMETPQQRADRLLAEDQAQRAGIEPVQLQPSRLRRALTPWFVGFDHPVMDAIGVAFALYFTVLLTAFAAMCWSDHKAPPASGAYSASMEATSRPAADTPLGGGTTGEAR